MSNELKKYWVLTSELKNYVEGDTTYYCEIVIADEVDTLLAEQDAEIEGITKTWSIDSRIIREQEIEIERLRNEARGMEEGIDRLHGNLNDCTERGTEAERIHREMIDLLEVITGESNETYPEMAVTDAVRLLMREKEEAEQQLNSMTNTLRWAYEKYGDAERKVKQLEKQYAQLDKDFSVAGEKDWENEDKLKVAERKIGYWQNRATSSEYNYNLQLTETREGTKKLQTATDALKEVKIAIGRGEGGLAVHVTNEALADIEGEPNKETLEAIKEIEEGKAKRFQDEDTLFEELGILEKTEQIHGAPDWEWIKLVSDGDSNGNFTICIAQTFLYLRDKLSKLEDDLDDAQSEIIRMKNE